MRKIFPKSLFLLCLLLCGVQLSASAREQSQMQHPDGPPPTGPLGSGFFQNNAPGGASNGGIPGLMQQAAMGNRNSLMTNPLARNEMVQQILSTRIPVGTVLTGVLTEDISSKKSVPGDLFYIVLPDGFYLSGREVVPRQSIVVGKIVGVVAAAMHKRGGQPGHVELGLTTLQFPDGRSCNFTGNIERNPAHDMKTAPTVRNAAMNIGDYGKQLTSMVGSFGSGFGFVNARRNRGRDLLLEKGEMVPIRVTRSIDLTQMSPPTITSPPAAMGAPSAMQSPPALTTPPPAPPVVPTANPAFLPKELPDPF
jgi:hypothetical protein